MKIAAVETRFIDTIWDEVGPIIQKALDKSHGEYWLEDIYRFLKEEKMYLLITLAGDDIIGAAVTQIIDYPRKRVFQVLYLAGDRMSEWFEEVYNMAKEGAKNVGAERLDAPGRVGWKKYMKQHGIEPLYITYSVEL